MRVTTWGSGGRAPAAAGGQRGFGGGAPNAAANFSAFIKK